MDGQHAQSARSGGGHDLRRPGRPDEGDQPRGEVGLRHLLGNRRVEGLNDVELQAEARVALKSARNDQRDIKRGSGQRSDHADGPTIDQAEAGHSEALTLVAEDQLFEVPLDDGVDTFNKGDPAVSKKWRLAVVDPVTRWLIQRRRSFL